MTDILAAVAVWAAYVVLFVLGAIVYILWRLLR